MSLIGHRNESLHRIGISKLRLMAGQSPRCVVCDKTMVRPPDGNHLCAEHYDWELCVVDSENIGDLQRERLLAHEND